MKWLLRWMLWHMRSRARWWMREKGCVALWGDLIRPKPVRLGLITLAQEHGALCWYRTPGTGEQWTILDENSEWHRQIKLFTCGDGTSGEGELIVCKANLNPNDTSALKHALEMFDTENESDVLLWALQIESDPYSIAFIAQDLVQPIRDLLRCIVDEEIIKDYSRLRPFQRFSSYLERWDP